MVHGPGRRRPIAALGLFLAVVGFGLASTALAPAALGHALLQSSDPATGSTVGASPAVITLTFGERADPRLSSIKVLDKGGANHASGPVQAVPASALQLQVPVQSLPDGVYTVSWRTLSAVDGHSAAGAFSFGVGVAVTGTGSGSAGSTTPAGLAGASPAAAVARLLLYVGLVALFGAGIVGWLIAPGRRRPLRGLLIASWLLSALGAAGVTALQWVGAESDIGAILGTSLGVAGIARFVAAVAGGAIVAVAIRSVGDSARGRIAFAALAGVAAIGMAIDVATGHAAAVEPAILQLAFQWLHVAATGFWLGGLAALLLAVRDCPADERSASARRFSIVAGFALAVVAVTGLLRAIAEIGTFDALFGTDYGRLVIAKSAILVGIAGLGAINHFWSVPVVGAAFRRLRRVGTVEISAAIVVLVLSSFLVDLAPPVSVGSAAGPPPAAPIVALGHDFGTSVRARLVVTPGAAGTNGFALALTDYDTKAPVEASAVSLRFNLASSSGVGPSSLDLTRSGPGTFEASGGNLSIDGIWEITATITASTGAVEVPLVAATVVPAQVVDINATPGAPTIDSVHLAGGGTVQLYLDPEVAGKTELHATFFDIAGTELPVATATLAIAQPGSPGEIPNERQLEPGHFVADIEVVAGDLSVDVVGPDPSGGPVLHVHLTMTVQP